jgi:hypothetical protein
MTFFDESRLDDEVILAAADVRLRALAESGARVRRAALAERATGRFDGSPRAIVAAGPDSRLLRAVLEPTCPVPFVAWPNAGLPGWVGSLDLIVVLAPGGDDPQTASAVAEAVRRGAHVLVATRAGSLVAQHAVGRDATVLEVDTTDQLAHAVLVLNVLGAYGLGPITEPEDVAVALDDVAIACSPSRELTVNPAKELAIAHGDTTPLVWGGSVPVARAARRIAESLRRTTGRTALAGGADQLIPLLERAPLRDVFADPFDGDGPEARPSLIVLDEPDPEPLDVHDRRRLVEIADARGVRVDIVSLPEAAASRTSLAHYAALVLQGRYIAEYLGIGLVED